MPHFVGPQPMCTAVALLQALVACSALNTPSHTDVLAWTLQEQSNFRIEPPQLAVCLRRPMDRLSAGAL